MNEGDEHRTLPRQDQGRFIVSLTLFVLWGLFISAWFIYYTDFYPVVGGLLGLGGLFAWIAFLSNLISEKRKDELQERFESFLLSKRFLPSLLILFALFLGLALFLGTVMLQSSENISRRISIKSPDDKRPWSDSTLEKWTVGAGNIEKSIWWTKPVWSGSYEIKAAGLPAITVAVKPFQRVPVYIPDSFYTRPVLLVVPDLITSATATNAATSGSPIYELALNVGGNEKGRQPYRGGTVWIGCDRDVTVPAQTLARWRLDFLIKTNTPEEVLSPYEFPESMFEEADLKEGDQVVLTLFSHGQVAATKKVTIRKPSANDFPQEVRLIP
jgi:hypothetical protein